MFFTERLTMDYLTHQRMKQAAAEGRLGEGSDDDDDAVVPHGRAHNNGASTKKPLKERRERSGDFLHLPSHGHMCMEVMPHAFPQPPPPPVLAEEPPREGGRPHAAADGSSDCCSNRCGEASTAAATAEAVEVGACSSAPAAAAPSDAARGAYANAALLEFSVAVHSIVIGLDVGLDSKRSLADVIIFTACAAVLARERELVALLSVAQ